MKQAETYYQQPIGHDGIWPPVPALSGYLARLDADTQERATRVMETGDTAGPLCRHCERLRLPRAQGQGSSDVASLLAAPNECILIPGN